MYIERRKKKNYKTYIYSALIVFLCLVIVVIAWPEDSSYLAAGEETPEKIGTDGQEPASDQDKETLNAGDFIEDLDEPDENQDIEQAGGTYYLVRRDESDIKVFFVDEEGNEIPLETTDIVYEVLGPEDQKLFDEGFRIETQEELAVLLQDFES